MWAPIWRFRERGLRALGDFVFGRGCDVISDVTRARRYGFHEAIKTEKMFARMSRDPRDRKGIP